MKGHHESNYGGGGWWMKKKMATVAVVILVGLMAVMVVQKVKDRRLFNLVIKDKDRQILSLHLLLQKERQYAKEFKRKNQDLNTKLYSIGTQKIELDNKIMEMRSTISSLRDEQRVLELTIDEKQNQIKNQETEMNDLKNSHQTPPKHWSVSSDDPSNQEVNLANKVMNPDVKVQKPKDEQLVGSKEYKDDAKIEMHNITVLTSKGYGQTEKSQLKATTNKTKSDVDKMDENQADLEASRNVSEVDQDYKEEQEE